MTTLTRALALLLALVLVAAACGSDDDENTTESADTSGESMEDEDMDDMDDMDMDDMDDMDMDDMNMGDPDATPASEVPGAELESGSFELLDTRPEGFDDVEGTAVIARHDGGTTVTIELTGLLPGEDYIAHLHDGPCDEGGGDHYMFDPDGPEMPPNEIHLLFTSAEDGSGFMTAENDMVAGPDGQSVVVHPLELQDNRIACAQLEA